MAEHPLVVVVGGMNMDIQARSAGPYRAGDSNPGQVSWSPGGVGRNIAANLAGLGQRVELVTVLGDDALSGELERSCRELGIGLAGVLRLPQQGCSQYLCLLDRDGSLVGAVAAMQGFDLLLPGALEERSTLLDSASLIVVDTNIPASSIGWLAERYGPEGTGESGPALALDPVSAAKASRARPWLGSFAFTKPNRIEAAVLAGEEAERDPRRLAPLLRRTGMREVFISLADEGIYYEGPDSGGQILRGYVRPPRTQAGGLRPVNVSGAGDAACAALAWGYGGGLSLARRAACALAAAMATAASAGTVAADLGPERLLKLAQGVIHEPLS